VEAQTTRSLTLFRYVGLASTFPPIPLEDPLNDDIERLFKKYLSEMKSEGTAGQAVAAEVLTKVQGMFSTMLKVVSDLRTHVDERFEEVHQELRGVKSRVTNLERVQPRSASLAPQQIRTLETYEKTKTGTFRLTDYELHELHSEAKTWRAIKSFTRAAAIPVTAAVVIALLAWLGVHLWVK
jgi:hypothetical protein